MPTDAEIEAAAKAISDVETIERQSRAEERRRIVALIEGMKENPVMGNTARVRNQTIRRILTAIQEGDTDDPDN